MLRSNASFVPFQTRSNGEEAALLCSIYRSLPITEKIKASSRYGSGELMNRVVHEVVIAGKMLNLLVGAIPTRRRVYSIF